MGIAQTLQIGFLRLSFLCVLFLLMRGSPDSDMRRVVKRNNCSPDYIIFDPFTKCSEQVTLYTLGSLIHFYQTMDNFPDGIAPQEAMALSYDDTVAYEEQVPTEAEREHTASLANRIGSTKVYLLAESSATTRVSKVRW